MIFVLDTHVAYDWTRLDQLRDALADRHEVFMPIMVVAELLFQRRRRWSHDAPFDDRMIIDRLRAYEPFLNLPHATVDDARRLAATLHKRYPTHDDWHQAKWFACTGNTNFGKTRKSAHLDHHIAAWATPDTPMITEEKRGEWVVLPPDAKYTVAEAIAKFGATP